MPDTTSISSAPELGAQLWLEPAISGEHVESLVQQAHDGGLSILRLMLLWPLVEPAPGRWAFAPFDQAVAACERRDMHVWITLSPESRPWHLGVPGMVQSAAQHLPSTPEERGRIEEFLSVCVRRYRHSPALTRWIAWNEPQRPGPETWRSGPLASQEERELWRETLKTLYPTVAELNGAWLTGYGSFDDVPAPWRVFPEGRRGEPFAAYGPWLAECRFRAAALAAEVGWVARTVRRLDPVTPISINLPGLFDAYAGTGFDLARLAQHVDVLGASVHAPWHLGFVPSDQHAAYVAAGMGLLKASAPRGRVELTEFQGGNVCAGAPDSADTDPEHVVASALAACASGAEAAVTWSLNSRSSGFEAGDWGMVNEDGSPAAVLAATRRLREVLDAVTERIGPFRPAPARGFVLVDEASTAVEVVRASSSRDPWGADPHRGVRAAASLVQAGLRVGHPVSLVTASACASLPDDATVMVPRLLGASDATVAAIEGLLTRGVRVVLDAEALRLDDRGALRPAEAFGLRHGFTVARLTQPADADRPGETTAVRWHGTPVGHSPGPSAVVTLRDEQWGTDPAWTVGADRLPLLRERTTEPLVLVHGALSALPAACPPLAYHLWTRYLGSNEVSALGAEAVVLRIDGATAAAWIVIAATDRRRVALRLPAGRWDDLWTGSTFQASDQQPVRLELDGRIAVLVNAGEVDRTARAARASSR